MRQLLRTSCLPSINHSSQCAWKELTSQQANKITVIPSEARNLLCAASPSVQIWLSAQHLEILSLEGLRPKFARSNGLPIPRGGDATYFALKLLGRNLKLQGGTAPHHYSSLSCHFRLSTIDCRLLPSHLCCPGAPICTSCAAATGAGAIGFGFNVCFPRQLSKIPTCCTHDTVHFGAQYFST
jgi:hypothetical protein